MRYQHSNAVMVSALILMQYMVAVRSQTANTYDCPSGEACIVRCSDSLFHDSCESHDRWTVNSSLASSLELLCGSCISIDVLCPNSGKEDSFCNISVAMDGVMSNSTVYSSNTADVSLTFAHHSYEDSVTIDGTLPSDTTASSKELEEQRISIECHGQSALCFGFTTKNLGMRYQSEALPNTNVHLSIICADSAQCGRLDIHAENVKTVNITMTGNGNALSLFNLSSPTLDEVWMYLGELEQSEIYAPFVREVFDLDVVLKLYDVTIVGPNDPSLAPLRINVKERGVCYLCAITGRFQFVSQHQVELDSVTLNAISAGNVSAHISETKFIEDLHFNIVNSSAWIEFLSEGAGQISRARVDAQNGSDLHVVCNDTFGHQLCTNLTLNVAPFTVDWRTHERTKHAELVCVDYACSRINVEAENGGNDLSVVSKECDCEETVYEHRSCIGQIEFVCDDGESAWFDGVSCSGSDACCGSIVDDAQCSNINRPVLEDWAVALIVIASVLFAILLGVMLWFYCKRKTQKSELTQMLNTGLYVNAQPEKEEKNYGAA